MLKKVLLISFIAIMVLAACVYAFVYVPTMEKHREVRDMDIANVDTSRIRDGVYSGEFTYASFTYIVEVTVHEKKISDIKVLQNRDSSYAKAAEGVADNVLDAQSLQVDVISGATTTSKALLKAMEIALQNAGGD